MSRGYHDDQWDDDPHGEEPSARRPYTTWGGDGRGAWRASDEGPPDPPLGADTAHEPPAVRMRCVECGGLGVIWTARRGPTPSETGRRCLRCGLPL